MADDGAVVVVVAFEILQGHEHLPQVFHAANGDPDGDDDRQHQHDDGVAPPETRPRRVAYVGGEHVEGAEDEDAEDAEDVDVGEDEQHPITETELLQSLDKVAAELPNYAIPGMNGVGAMEIAVSSVEGVCDFISAMDTARIQEWNTWYHLLNCGQEVKVSGETDFPCMSGSRVGQGRVYVKLGKVNRLDFGSWCTGLAFGQSYVSDGFAHALAFSVNGVEPGFGEVRLDKSSKIAVRATVAFAHLLFNCSGAIIFLPYQPIREIPVKFAEWLAELCLRNRAIPIAFIVVFFYLIPIAVTWNTVADVFRDAPSEPKQEESTGSVPNSED